MENRRWKIGDYEEGDVDQIVAIERDSFPTPWSENIFRREIASPISRLLVARSNIDRTGVVGYLVYWQVADEIQLHKIAVRRDMRRQGIGSLMLGECVCRSMSEGARWLTLEVRRSNDAGLCFYEKFGCSVRGSRRGYYTDTREDALILWADLSLTIIGEGASRDKGRNSMPDMQAVIGDVIENRRVAPEHFQMAVQLPRSFPTPLPGQFVMIRDGEHEEPLLARPFSVYGFQRQGDRPVVDLLYRITGRGTSLLSRMSTGARLSVLGPLGKGFALPTGIRKVILVAGGVGVAPLVFLLQSGLFPPGGNGTSERIFYLGARTAELLTGLERLNGLCDIKICTDDGSREYCGQVTDLLCQDIGGYDPEETMIFACGPWAMIRSMEHLLKANPIRCQVSLEERMACGIGACLGCAVAVCTEAGTREYRRVCKDGPVFDLQELVFASPAGA